MARISSAPEVIAWLGKVGQRFAGRILPLDAATLHVWAQIAAQAELAGQPLAVMDGLIVATRNVQGFASYPRVFNPWAL